MMPTLEPLPIDVVLPELTARLREVGAVVLRAPTGAGKTTRVPPAVTDAGRVLLLEPRRDAARAAARRMAAEDSTPLGQRVGYHVRFDRVSGPRTAILAVTPGILLRMLLDDPFLESVGTVIFDEFHERQLDADLALGMVRLIRQTVRPELRIVVMSATLDAGPLSAYLGHCPIVVSEGRMFPVEVRYRPRRNDMTWPQATANAVRELVRETDSGVLVFLPGMAEIRRTTEALSDLADQGFAVLPLHGDLPPEQQDRAILPLQGRKIVLATNVAETSVTVDGIAAVVDTGLARQLEFDPGVGLDRLRLVPISRASADQRAGRAGRTQPGVCVRLWEETSHRGRPEQTVPEIHRVDLTPAILHLLAMGEHGPGSFPWFDPPSAGAIERAFDLLRRLDAVCDSGLSQTGIILAALPVHPRLGRLIFEGQRLGHPERAALAAAVLAERDPFERTETPRSSPDTRSDLLDRIEALEAFEQRGQRESPLGRLHRTAAGQLLRVREQLLRSLPDAETVEACDPDDAVLRALLAAFPDRLARRRSPGDSRARMVGGRGVRIDRMSGVREAELFLCIDVEAGGVDSPVRMASAVRREWLPENLVTTSIEVTFDTDSEKLLSRKLTRFDDLVLEDVGAGIVDEEQAAQVLAAAAAANLDRVLPPPDSDAGRFRTRVRCLRAWMPELELPAFDPNDLADRLRELCRGCRSFANLRNGPWLSLFRNALTFPQQQVLDREAPDRFLTPAGRANPILYEEGRPPILAVRIQDLFGVAETPRIAAGRIKLLLHLLAPNGRPQQVTDDLASFWKNGYPIVRKELRGRYPKHRWPEDPMSEPPKRTEPTR